MHQPTTNSATSKSATANSDALKWCNINGEIRNSATLISAKLNRVI